MKLPYVIYLSVFGEPGAREKPKVCSVYGVSEVSADEACRFAIENLDLEVRLPNPATNPRVNIAMWYGRHMLLGDTMAGIARIQQFWGWSLNQLVAERVEIIQAQEGLPASGKIPVSRSIGEETDRERVGLNSMFDKELWK